MNFLKGVKIMKVGDKVKMIHGGKFRNQYHVLHTFTNDNNPKDKLVIVSFIGNDNKPQTALINACVFELFPENEKE